VINQNTWKQRWHAIQVIRERYSKVSLGQLGIYVITTVALATSALTLHNTLRFTERNVVFISNQPLFMPILVCAVLLSLYLGVTASISVSRERDRKTLEVLMYGPVDESSFLLGIFFAQVQIFLIALAFTFIWSNLAVWLLNLGFSFDVFGVFLASIVMTSAIVAFGQLTAVWGDKTRTALIVFILILLFLAGIQVADQIVSAIVISSSPTSNDPILIIRNALATATRIIQWVSPYSQLVQAMDSVSSHSLIGFISNLGVLLAQTLILLYGSIHLLKVKGARG
jgi:ABC-type transport system involved in multi-copper enzyme maturation permease subunit